MSYTLINRIGTPQVTLAEAKAQSRITHNAEDTQIQTYLDSAIAFCENYTHRLMQTSIVKTFFECDNIDLTRPVRAINSINYIDTNGNQQTTTDYSILRDYDNAVNIKLTNIPDSKQIWIEYVAGYGDYTVTGSELEVINQIIHDMPMQLKIAALMISADFYNIRGNTTEFKKYKPPLAAEILLDQVRIYI